jgi:hypothetical protein
VKSGRYRRFRGAYSLCHKGNENPEEEGTKLSQKRQSSLTRQHESPSRKTAIFILATVKMPTLTGSNEVLIILGW